MGNVQLTRSKLEQLVEPMIKKTQGPCEACNKDADLKPSEINEVLLVGGMTRMPLVTETVRKIYQMEPSKAVNPDEAVAMGAAIQAGVLKGDVKDILLLDVTPLSLGIETLGGIFTRLITRNTTIPTKKSMPFTTASDNQTQVGIKVYQGEREMAAENNLLGQFELSDIPPAPKNVPKIDVTFDIDANGIVNVSAQDQATGKVQNVVIEVGGGLSDADIERMMQEAEANKEADQQRKELIEMRNSADQLVLDTDKMFNEHKDKLSEEDQKAVEEALQALREEKDSEDSEIESLKEK